MIDLNMTLSALIGRNFALKQGENDFDLRLSILGNEVVAHVKVFVPKMKRIYKFVKRIKCAVILA